MKVFQPLLPVFFICQVNDICVYRTAGVVCASLCHAGKGRCQN